MQKWWLIGAGVVGVVLAVVLLGRPLDTGGEITTMTDGPVTLTEGGEGAQPGGLVRDAAGNLVPDGEQAVAAGVVASDRPIRVGGQAMVRPGFTPPDPTTMVAGANPMAQRAAARRDTPEARLAAQTTAPWTQVRREIAKAAGDDPAASALIGDVQTHLDDLRSTQRDPQAIDFSDVERRQTELSSRVRQSPYHNSEVERMLVLVEERVKTYKSDR
ncbi:MAG: hypothetical protein ACJATT_003638 [Myxococcota bacterium]|jgi:hypothetical protein